MLSRGGRRHKWPARFEEGDIGREPTKAAMNVAVLLSLRDPLYKLIYFNACQHCTTSTASHDDDVDDGGTKYGAATIRPPFGDINSLWPVANSRIIMLHA